MLTTVYYSQTVMNNNNQNKNGTFIVITIHKRTRKMSKAISRDFERAYKKSERKAKNSKLGKKEFERLVLKALKKNMDISMSPMAVLSAVVAMIITGSLLGIFPALTAVKSQPIESIKE